MDVSQFYLCIILQVLAKVLAAIVKFDSNQLNTILQKEEQKVSLVSIYFNNFNVL